MCVCVNLMERPRVSSSSSTSSLSTQLSGDMTTSAVASKNLMAARSELYWSTQFLQEPIALAWA